MMFPSLTCRETVLPPEVEWASGKSLWVKRETEGELEKKHALSSLDDDWRCYTIDMTMAGERRY
jgi:hypothetical protein